MAKFLYRLGFGASRRPWIVIVAWAVLIALGAGAMSSLAKPLSTEFKLPGSEFSRVLGELKTEIPAASGGSGTIVLHSKDGKFTPEQTKAIRAAIKDWETVGQVRTVTDPFELQQSIDDGERKLTKGEKQLAKGERKLADGRYKLGQYEWLNDQGRKKVAQLERTRPADDPELQQYRDGVALADRRMVEIRKKLGTGADKVEAGDEKLQRGKALFELSDGLRFVSEDGETAFAQVMFTDAMPAVDPDHLAEIPKVGKQLEDEGIEVDYGQEIVQTTEIGGVGEAIGLAVAAVVLLVMLGSLVMAGMPLSVAFVGVGTSVLFGLSMSHWFSMHQMAPMLGSMLGLAVGIDYALFIVNRHRNQLAEIGPHPTKDQIRRSIGLASGTAGNAVVVAGATVVIALAALALSGVPVLVQMGLLAAFTVLTTVLVALTLTPALLGLAGRRAVPRRVRKSGVAAGERHNFAARWVNGATTKPWLAMLGVVLVLGTLALPALSLRLGLPDGSAEPQDSTAYQAFSRMEKDFGAGANGPIVAMAKFDDPIAKGQVQQEQVEVGRELKQVSGIKQVAVIGVSDDRSTIAFQLMPDQGPSDEQTVDAVHTLRDYVAPRMADDGVDLGLTGATVANIEVSERLASSLPGYLALVVGLSLILLLMVFRSVIVPLVATGGFLLSVAASFGVVVAIYQWGWLGEVFGVHSPSAILSFMPTLLIGILFGLAMDYQMFLVSGMREAYVHGRSPVDAVRTGYRAGARVVTAAAIIMISVFGGFVFSHMTMIRPIGLGLAIGVLVEAFGVRMTLTPAVMALLGEKVWWMPKWLDRVLPNLDVEGAKLAEGRSLTEPEDEDERAHELEPARA